MLPRLLRIPYAGGINVHEEARKRRLYWMVACALGHLLMGAHLVKAQSDCKVVLERQQARACGESRRGLAGWSQYRAEYGESSLISAVIALCFLIERTAGRRHPPRALCLHIRARSRRSGC